MYGAEYHERMVGHEDAQRTLAYRAENTERIRSSVVAARSKGITWCRTQGDA